MVAIALGKSRDMQISDVRDLIGELSGLPDKISETLMHGPHIKKLAKKYSAYDDMFVLGRNYFYPVAGEASLKCKELSYIHCEAYSAGELKHGPLALVSTNFPTLVFNPMGKFYSKTISNIQEIAAREGPILGFISKNDTHKELYTDAIELPETSELLSVFTGLVSSYLFALYLAEALGRDVDKPRNLAKSVTVE
jgi:glucosamine--fructose-6-phosphate aminotransferase (isomerizing)